MWTSQGLYCEEGGFYIDPMPSRARATLPPLDLAIITHAHSDHARRGSARYLCEQSGLGLLRSRLGKVEASGIPYREPIQLGGVSVGFHSAGHILGSAQIRVQRGNEVWVASGDYKRDSDPSCEPFEVVKCDTFITEATFGTHKFAWPKAQQFGKQIIDWWKQNTDAGYNTVVFGYSLGKAQRILAELAPFAEKPVLIHSSVSALTECYRLEGRVLAPTLDLAQEAAARELQGEIVLAPPSALKETWAPALGKYKTAFASGWMQGTGRGAEVRAHQALKRTAPTTITAL